MHINHCQPRYLEPSQTRASASGVARALRPDGPRAWTRRIEIEREITSLFLGILRWSLRGPPLPQPYPPTEFCDQRSAHMHPFSFYPPLCTFAFFLPVSARNRLGSEAPRHYPAGAALAIVTDGLI